MEDTFRNALIIISAIVIGAIFVHGLWTIRKNKNPYKLKAKQGEEFEPMEPKVDRSGFDQDGIGQVKVVGKNVADVDAELTIAEQQPVTKEFSAEHRATESLSSESSLTDPSLAEPSVTKEENFAEQVPQQQTEVELDATAELNLTATKNEPEIGDLSQLEQTVKEPESVYQAPVTQPKPERKKPASSSIKSKASLKRNQMEMDFDDDSVAEASAVSRDKASSAPELEPEVLVLSVVMPENQVISGAALLPSLLTLGMRYGDMNIFHRHQDNAGNGKVTFSLANMMNPGTFDLDDMESFVTQGVSLFMTLPNAGDSFEVFQQMLAAAKQLAQEYQGQVLDDKRSVMTKQTEQHYISKIREFERKKRIAQV